MCIEMNVKLNFTWNKDLLKHVIPKMLNEDLTSDCCLNLCSYIVLTTDFRIEKCIIFAF